MKKLISNYLKYLLTVGMLSFHISTMAEDVDLFAGVPSSVTALPNVLFVIDNTANWNNAFTNEMSALASVVSGLPANKFKVGIMMFTETGSGNSNTAGAYVRAAIRPLDTNNKIIYQNLVNSFGVNADKSNGGKAGLAMEEAYLYLSGGIPYAGNNKVKTDYTGNTSGTPQSNAVYALPNQALPSIAGSPYSSPVVEKCAKNFIIYISNGAVQDNASSTSIATSALSAAGGDTTTIPVSPSGSQSNVSDEWTRFMKKSGLAVTTYTVDINKVATGQGPGWSALLKSMAGVSGGKYFDVSSTGTQVADALTTIFSEIQSVNSTFASVSLPVSINTQGTFINQFYIGMFRPDQNSAPRWSGNLKQYKLGYSNNVLQLLDADNQPAIDSTTGFIAPCARSFWTPTILDNYWTFHPQGNCLTANSDISNTPDGSIVEKGAQAYVLRGSTIRNIKTCSPASCSSLINFDNVSVTPAMLGASSVTEQIDLVNWETGLDVDDENINGITLLEKRPSVHGDVVHSRPLAINYGTDVAPQVVVFYGGNDGILRAINGNRSASNGSSIAGGELWSFVAPEFYNKIKRIRDNVIPISFPGRTTGTPTPQPKDYGVDGPVTGYQDTTSTSIFATLRRGGRAMYAFNVTSPANPILKWKIGCPNMTDDIGCSAGFSGLGQTWSSGKIIKSSGFGSGLLPLLIMGGGYDTCQDADPNSSCSASSKGKSIYVMDANSGSLLKTFNTDSSVIADLTIVNDSTGIIQYAYGADLGGNIYRISGATANTPIGITPPALWTITKIAALGGSGVDNRKFMFAPDVLNDNGTYDILIGSGDREKPLASTTASSSVNNRFYMVKDKPTDLNWLSSESSNCGANIICTNSLFAITGTVAPTINQLAGKKGWYLPLASAEQVVTSAITVFGTVTFSTHIPTPPTGGACASLGTANVYNINFQNASPAIGTVRGTAIVGGGLPPSPVAGMVTLDNGKTVPFIIGASSSSALQGINPIQSGAAKRAKSRIYWNIKK